MHPKIGFLAGWINSCKISCYTWGRWPLHYTQLACMQLCWAYVSYISFCCIDIRCGNTNTKQAPPGTPPQLLHLLSGSRVVMNGLHLMDGCKRACAAISGTSGSSCFLCCLSPSRNTLRTDRTLHTPSFPQVFGEWCEYTFPQISLSASSQGPPSYPKQKRFWWPVK